MEEMKAIITRRKAKKTTKNIKNCRKWALETGVELVLLADLWFICAEVLSVKFLFDLLAISELVEFVDFVGMSVEFFILLFIGAVWE